MRIAWHQERYAAPATLCVVPSKRIQGRSAFRLFSSVRKFFRSQHNVQHIVASASQRWHHFPECCAAKQSKNYIFCLCFVLTTRVGWLSKNDVRIKSIHRKNEEPSICSTCDLHKRNKSSDTEMSGKCCPCFDRHIIRLVLAERASYNLIKKNTRCRNGIDVSAHCCFATELSLVQCNGRQVKQTTTTSKKEIDFSC